MATLVGLSGYQYGIENAETSIEVKSFVVNISPQFKTFALSRTNENKGFALGPIRLAISLNGDISATSSGWWSWTFSTAITLGNDITYFGTGGTGGVYLDSAVVTQTSDNFKTMSAELSLDVGIT